MMSKLSDWLSTQTKTRGWSIRELARRADISHTTVAEVLSGQRAPTFEFCAAIAAPLELDPVEVFRLADLLPPLPPNVDAEEELLHAFRQIPSDQRQVVLTMVKALANEQID